VYVASSGDQAVTAFARDPGTGSLSLVQSVREGVGGVEGLAQARAVAVSPDGMHVYAGGASGAALAVFARDGVTGALRFLEVERNGRDGVTGLTGVADVVVTPDRRHVIVAANGESTLVVFARDPSTGALRFVQVIRDGASGVDGLGSVRGLAISADGATVYAASPSDSSVVAFRRDVQTGQLTFLEAARDGVGGVEGLAFATKVAVSSDGRSVYAAGSGADAVTTFARDPATGRLSYVETQRNGDEGVDGLRGAFWLAPSPDDRHIYVVGLDANAVAVFAAGSVRHASAALPIMVAVALCAGLLFARSYRRRRPDAAWIA
jgi:6-phosphogluconolactonase (cycloisomerase 2 family)